MTVSSRVAWRFASLFLLFSTSPVSARQSGESTAYDGPLPAGLMEVSLGSGTGQVIGPESPRVYGYPVADFWYRASVGDAVHVYARSSSALLDPYLLLEGPANAVPSADLALPVVAENDDALSDGGAFLGVAIPSSGWFRFRIRPVDPSSSGEVVLGLLAAPQGTIPLPSSPGPGAPPSTTPAPTPSSPVVESDSWSQSDGEAGIYEVEDAVIQVMSADGFELIFRDEYMAMRGQSQYIYANDPDSGAEMRLVLLEEGGTAPARLSVYRESYSYGQWHVENNEGLGTVWDQPLPEVWRTGTRFVVPSGLPDGQRLVFEVDAGASAGYPSRRVVMLVFAR